MARVTVVMRTFERPVLLARAIASVRHQTFTDWHLVIVNNGGAPGPVDDAVAVARTGMNAGEISVIHLPGQVGMERASNEGLRATESDYFAIHDDDDTWNPEFLSVTVARLDADRGAAGVVTALTKVHETMKGDKVWPVRDESFWLVPGRLTFRGMIGANTFPPVAALFRRSVLGNVGMFDESLPVLGDWEFNLRAVRAGGFLFEPQILARYHVRTPESDRSTANSIIDGADLHKSVRLELQDRWLGETVDGVNKGMLSVAAQATLETEELRTNGLRVVSESQVDVIAVANHTANVLQQRRMTRRIWRGLRHPGHALRAVARTLRG